FRHDPRPVWLRQVHIASPRRRPGPTDHRPDYPKRHPRVRTGARPWHGLSVVYLVSVAHRRRQHRFWSARKGRTGAPAHDSRARVAPPEPSRPPLGSLSPTTFWGEAAAH